MTAQSSSGGKQWLLRAVAVCGVLVLAAASWKVYFSAEPGAALTVLLVTGGVLLVSPLVLPRLQTVAVSADGFELRLIQEIAEQGAPETARLLNHSELAETAQTYGVVHTQLAGEDFKEVRTKVEDQLVSRASAFALQHSFDPNEIKQLFPKATAPVRVLILGLMKGDPRLVDPTALASAIALPLTANEQYHALELAENNLRRFTGAERTTLLAAIDKADLGAETSGRRLIASRIKALT